jgi:uncharacterized iron-regulated protein
VRRLAIASIVLVAGCSTTLSRSARRDLVEELAVVGFDVPADQLDVVTFVDASSGMIVDQAGLAELVDDYAIVMVGERHDVAAHHLAQRDVVLAVRSRAEGFPVVIGAEMFAVDKQDLISRWEETEFDTATFLDMVGWDESWGVPWEVYAPVLELALYEDIALVGLNAPAGLSRAVYRGGIESLDEEQAQQLPLPFGPVPDAYREYLVGALAGHMPRPEGSGDDVAQWEASVENFVMAQRVWDESMAARLFEAYQGFGVEARHVVLAGGGHVRNGWGIESALRRYSDVAVLRVMCVSLDGSPESSAELRDLVATGAADLYCITR